MNRSKYQKLISSDKTTPKQIDTVVSQVLAGPMAYSMQLLLCAEHTLTAHLAPHAQLNALFVLISLLKNTKYHIIILLEQVFLDILKIPARVAAGPSQQSIYEYFKVPSSHSDLQTLSYHFTHTSLEICLLLAYLKPRLLYKHKESSMPSKAQNLALQLKETLQEQEYSKIVSKHGFLTLRKAFAANFIQFNRSPHSYVDFFMNEMEQYLISSAGSHYFGWFKKLTRNEDVYLTSEALVRLAEIVCFHKSFQVKRNALTLIAEMAYFGNLQALLLINFTDYFSVIAGKLQQAFSKSKKEPIQYFYPQIDGQQRQKKAFMHDFLLLIKRIATVFPSLDIYFVDVGQSPIYQLYVALLEKGVQFPHWQGEEYYKAKMLKHFKDKKEYNNLFLQELDKQKTYGQLALNPLRPSVRELKNLYERNKENLQQFLDNKDPSSKEWAQLIEFRKHFESYFERLGQQGAQKEVENLISDSIQLAGKIQYLQSLVGKLQKKELSLDKFESSMSQFPSNLENEKQQRLTSIKESLKSRSKQSLRCNFSQSEEVIKSKMTVKVQELVKKRSDQITSVTHLQLFSRPFLASNLHGKAIADSLQPLLQLHPGRKDKRTKIGIKLHEQEKVAAGQTPKFRSTIVNRKSEEKHQIKLFGEKQSIHQKNQQKKQFKELEQKYGIYFAHLQDQNTLEDLKHSSMVLREIKGVRIERGALLRPTKDRLKITYYIECISGTKEIQYTVIEEPSVKIDVQYKILNLCKAQLRITGQFLKFGFRPPRINFKIHGISRVCTLPFALHNFLNIRPLKQLQNFERHHYVLPYRCRPFLWEEKKSLFHHFLSGVQIQGGIVGCGVEIGCWQCNWIMRENQGELEVQIEQSKESQVLGQLLVVLAGRLFTNHKPIVKRKGYTK